MAENSQAVLKHKLEVCAHIAKLVRAEIPLNELEKLHAHSTGGTASLAKEVSSKLTAGQSLVHALASDRSHESRILAACIEAGEAANQLDQALEGWFGMHVANAKSSVLLRSALLYPCLLIIITFASLSFGLWHLIPQYETTYALFDQKMPTWLQAIAWFRSQWVAVVIVMLVLMLLPSCIWFYRRRGLAADGLPREKATRLRQMALSTKLASLMLQSETPLNKIAPLASQACGGSEEDVAQAFTRLQNQKRIQPLPAETSLILASLHAGAIDAQDANQHLGEVWQHLAESAEEYSLRQARWLPMLVALTVGVVTVLTYVLLIYLPWIWLMQKIVAPAG